MRRPRPPSEQKEPVHVLPKTAEVPKAPPEPDPPPARRESLRTAVGVDKKPSRAERAKAKAEEAEPENDVAQLADRRVGEPLFQVVLPQRDDRGPRNDARLGAAAPAGDPGVAVAWSGLRPLRGRLASLFVQAMPSVLVARPIPGKALSPSPRPALPV